MHQEKLDTFKTLFEKFKTLPLYKERINQQAITPIFRAIIRTVLHHPALTNQHLTDFIQLFKYNSTQENIDRKLAALIPDEALCKRFREELMATGQRGFTNAGRTAIYDLSSEQLAAIRQFLINAFDVSGIEGAIKLCRDFEALNIPQVKKGIYSPWLYYIEPEIFPILNNSHLDFQKWLGMSISYPEAIEEFNQLNRRISEVNLGAIDSFAHHFEGDGQINSHRVHYLNGNSLYKVSHGIFVKNGNFIQSGILDVLERNNWISLSRYTGKGQGEAFQDEIRIGDLFYLCYGGDRIRCVGRITSEAKLFSDEHAEMIGDDDEEWMYREFEPLYYPINNDITDLKSFRSHTMPSGNSTFWRIKPIDLQYLNRDLFKPKFDLEILEGAPEETIPEEDELSPSDNNDKTTMSLNTILYGPPGTGKTYSSISHAVAIIEHKEVAVVLDEDRVDVKRRFDNYLQKGQVVFCTFHQGMSYEDFIEGIKPVVPANEGDELYYAVEDGIFKRLCTEAAFSYVDANDGPGIAELLNFSDAYDRFVDNAREALAKGEPIYLATKNGGRMTLSDISDKGNILVRHKDGREKPFTVSKSRLSMLAANIPDLQAVSNINKQFRAEIRGMNATAYWAVLNAIRTEIPAQQLQLDKTIINAEPRTYEDKKSVIGSLDNSDYKKTTHQRFVLIIDEINRGNVSKIFGELITLLEDDKRSGRDEALNATLPYSKESFGVPPNLHIIGTMNTADRSVEALDTALRRRFSFLPLMPEESRLKDTTDGINLASLLATLNYRLRILKDADHAIGHAWLWHVKTFDDLKAIYANKILPLLQEYFYNDYEKLGLVLGDRFFRKHEQVNSQIFAPFSAGFGLAEHYEQSWIFILKPAEELTYEDFKSLEVLPGKTSEDER